METKQFIVINGYRTRQEVATLLGISPRALYNILTGDALADKIPKRGRLAPAHQQLLYDHIGVPYTFEFG
jgi:hypothetical protein